MVVVCVITRGESCFFLLDNELEGTFTVPDNEGAFALSAGGVDISTSHLLFASFLTKM